MKRRGVMTQMIRVRRNELQIDNLRRKYSEGSLRPRDVIVPLYESIRSTAIEPVWTYLLPRDHVDAQLKDLDGKTPADLPLYGIPFAIKDNFDLAGHPTTAGCPEFAYTPASTAPVVDKLIQAGAILIGKTALDQFATGTTGTRSPYGPCPSALDPEYVAGGSSSGSAAAVGAGLVSFSLGTDTAGSGRIPAALNGIVGLKPTRGLVSIRGIVPACRSIDCVAVFTQTTSASSKVTTKRRPIRGRPARHPDRLRGDWQTP
jgi:allophanate hydrolase